MSRSVSDVSVVTVNWNGKHHLEQLLPSLEPLGCREILVIDNGSEDGSREFLRSRYPAVRLLENDVNRGFAQPSNLGARRAKGRYVAFINNDMRAHPDWLQQAVRRLDEETPCVACRILDWDGKRIDYNGSSLQYLGYALQKDVGEPVDEPGEDEDVLFPCGGAMVVDREVFLQVGGFDEDFFAVFEDVDLGWRLWIAGFRVKIARESLVFHRGHGTFRAYADEKLRYLMHRNAFFTIFKNYEDETLGDVLPAALITAVRRAVLFSGVRKESFYLWERERVRLDAGDPVARDQLIDSLNHLVSIDDFFESLPSLLRKRQVVQRMRKRSDRELTPLFGEPLRAIVEDPEYIDLEASLLELLGLDRLFDSARYREKARDLEPRLEERVEELRRELKALQRLGVESLSRPAPPPRNPGPRRFLQSWKRDGFRTACRRALRHFHR